MALWRTHGPMGLPQLHQQLTAPQRTHGPMENPWPHRVPTATWTTHSPMENPWSHGEPTAPWRSHGPMENPHPPPHGDPIERLQPHEEPIAPWKTYGGRTATRRTHIPMENPWPHRTPTALRCTHTPWSTHSPQPALGPCMALDFGCHKGEGCPLLQVGVAPCFGPHVSIPHGAPQAPRGPRGGVTVTQMSLLWVRGGRGGDAVVGGRRRCPLGAELTSSTLCSPCCS